MNVPRPTRKCPRCSVDTWALWGTGATDFDTVVYLWYCSGCWLVERVEEMSDKARLLIKAEAPRGRP